MTSSTVEGTEASQPSSPLQEILDSLSKGDNTLLLTKQALTAGLANHEENYAVRESDLDVLITTLSEKDITTSTADVLLTAFYAGQDLVGASHNSMCFVLYKRYQDWFHKLKQPSDDNRQRIDSFIASQGKNKPFGNVMAL